MMVTKEKRRVPLISRTTSAVLVSIFLCIPIRSVNASIAVISYQSNQTVEEFSDAPASFVPDRVSYYGLRGYAVYSDPPNACSTVQPTPNLSTAVNWILVARRGDCDFQIKIENGQNMGYAAIIIHNVGSNRTEPITVKNPERLVIFATFIGEYNGLLLRDKYSVNISAYDYYLAIEDDFSFSGYILPFAIVVTLCFVVMLLFMVRLVWQQCSRWMQERRRDRRRKLPNSVLKKLPITKWTKGDPYETCAVCLEDFVEQDKVRVLPCSHGFHAICIDPWLTKNRRVCPICKRKVILAEEQLDTDSDSDDETTPLLRNPTTSNPNPATSTSTFIQNEDALLHTRVLPSNSRHRRPRFPRRPITHARQPEPRQRQDNSDSPDSSSVSSSGSSEDMRCRSVPVLAEVHGSSSLGQRKDVLPKGARAPFPSLRTHPSPSSSSAAPRDSADESISGLRYAINMDTATDVDNMGDVSASDEYVPQRTPDEVV